MWNGATVMIHRLGVTFYTTQWKKQDYNTFKNMNISTFDQVSELFHILSHPDRLKILMAIGMEETCVCHLEAMLGLKQAALSQHLMLLRKAGLVVDRRAGRFIHYQLQQPDLLEIIRRMAHLQGVIIPELSSSSACGCPNCCNKREECDG